MTLTTKLYTINETRGWECEQSIYYIDRGNDKCRHYLHQNV